MILKYLWISVLNENRTIKNYEFDMTLYARSVLTKRWQADRSYTSTIVEAWQLAKGAVFCAKVNSSSNGTHGDWSFFVSKPSSILVKSLHSWKTRKINQIKLTFCNLGIWLDQILTEKRSVDYDAIIKISYIKCFERRYTHRKKKIQTWIKFKVFANGVCWLWQNLESKLWTE